MSDSRNFTNNQFYIICIIAFILGALYLVSAFSQRSRPPQIIDFDSAETAWKFENVKKVPFASDSQVTAYFKNNNIVSLVLFDSNGKFIWTDNNGNVVSACGKYSPSLSGCNGLDMKKLKLKRMTEFEILGVEASDCIIGRHQGLIGWMHSNPAAAGHVSPCHH